MEPNGSLDLTSQMRQGLKRRGRVGQRSPCKATSGAHEIVGDSGISECGWPFGKKNERSLRPCRFISIMALVKMVITDY